MYHFFGTKLPFYFGETLMKTKVIRDTDSLWHMRCGQWAGLIHAPQLLILSIHQSIGQDLGTPDFLGLVFWMLYLFPDL
jgi:hypothetical protein